MASGLARSLDLVSSDAGHSEIRSSAGARSAVGHDDTKIARQKYGTVLLLVPNRFFLWGIVVLPNS